MTAAIAFISVLAGIVILFTLLLSLCALRMSSDLDRESERNPHRTAIVPNHLLAKDRRKILRQDFPIACSDGSYAWFDRRRTAFK